MLKNYLKIAYRNLIQNKTYSFINIVGLSTGMAIVLLIGFWIQDEYSFDHYFQKHKQLALIVSTQTWNNETTSYENIPVPLAEVLRTKYSSDIKNVVLITGSENHTLWADDKKVTANGVWAQGEFPDMFSLKMLQGSRNALKDPSGLLISRSTAKALFKNDDPLNKPVLVDKKFNLKVAGVYEDMPSNTRFHGMAMLLPWTNLENAGQQETSWSNYHFQGFVEIYKHSGFEHPSAKIKYASLPYTSTKSKEALMLQPLDRAHLYNEFKNGKAIGGRIQILRLFGIIGIIILLLSCINFMNLSTARSQKRAREVGVRKTMGSLRQHLIAQFLCESLLVSFVSLILTILLVIFSLSFFNSLADKQITIPWNRPLFWAILGSFTFITGLLAGSYPAFYLSGFEPIKVLKGTFTSGKNSSLPRKFLVVFQFSVSLSLTIGTIIVFRQIQFAKSRPIGYSQAGLISMSLSEPEMLKHYDAFKNEILQSGAVTDIAESSSPLTNIHNQIVSFDWKGRDPHSATLIGLIAVSHDFGKTVGWKIKEGRDFSREFIADSANGGAFILNEAAARLINYEKTPGNILKMAKQEHQIVGVAENMLMNSPYSSAEPTVFWLNYNWRIRYLTMRLRPEQSTENALAIIKLMYKKYSPGSSFQYEFVDDQYNAKFFDEQRIGKLSTFFAFFAIFISCLGLFGVASFVAEQRTKEIGVRKVLGASVLQIIQLLTAEFVLLVFFAFLLAAPIAFYFLNDWLQNYELHTSISWWMFVLPGLCVLLITLLTISFHTTQAALANPVNSLKSA